MPDREMEYHRIGYYIEVSAPGYDQSDAISRVEHGEPITLDRFSRGAGFMVPGGTPGHPEPFLHAQIVRVNQLYAHTVKEVED